MLHGNGAMEIMWTSDPCLGKMAIIGITIILPLVVL